MRTLAFALVLALPATAQPEASPPSAAAPAAGAQARFPAARAGSKQPLDKSYARLPGYLTPDRTPDAFAVLPPPPTPRSDQPAEALDRAAYLDTRKLQGSPRWALASRDAVESAAAAAADFDCVLGLDLTPERAPALLHLLTRLRTDAGHITGAAKNRFQHPRPFVTYGGPICTEAERDGIAHSWGYPSGHTTMMWAMGLVMAELAPDRATDLLSRARAYGESRVVCGVHTVSDVEEGRTTGAMLVAALHADPQFRADLEAARVELAGLRAQPGAAAPAGRMCEVERDAMARTPWLPAKAPAPAQPGPPPRG